MKRAIIKLPKGFGMSVIDNGKMIRFVDVRGIVYLAHKSELNLILGVAMDRSFYKLIGNAVRESDKIPEDEEAARQLYKLGINF